MFSVSDGKHLVSRIAIKIQYIAHKNGIFNKDLIGFQRFSGGSDTTLQDKIPPWAA